MEDVTMDLFVAFLEKRNVVFWDEDKYTLLRFPAEDIEQACRAVATLVCALNRNYERIGEPRHIRMVYLKKTRMKPFQLEEVECTCADTYIPYRGYKMIRKVLTAFFQRNEKGRYVPVNGLHAFTNFRPTPSPQQTMW